MKMHILGVGVAKRFRQTPLRNIFYLVRHGQSEANVEGIIVSDPSIGTTKYTLTKRGISQATRAGVKIESIFSSMGFQKSQVQDNLIIICSDFARTVATAKCIAKEVGLKESNVNISIALRERYFGDLDGQKDDQYELVWKHDNDSASHSMFGSESVNSVLLRAGNLVTELNEKYTDKVIVLVAHGDVLQILRTGFESQFPPAHHRRGEALLTGSVTRLQNNV